MELVICTPVNSWHPATLYPSPLRERFFCSAKMDDISLTKSNNCTDEACHGIKLHVAGCSLTSRTRAVSSWPFWRRTLSAPGRRPPSRRRCPPRKRRQRMAMPRRRMAMPPQQTAMPSWRPPSRSKCSSPRRRSESFSAFARTPSYTFRLLSSLSLSYRVALLIKTFLGSFSDSQSSLFKYICQYIVEYGTVRKKNLWKV